MIVLQLVSDGAVKEEDTSRNYKYVLSLLITVYMDVKKKLYTNKCDSYDMTTQTLHIHSRLSALSKREREQTRRLINGTVSTIKDARVTPGGNVISVSISACLSTDGRRLQTPQSFYCLWGFFEFLPRPHGVQ